MALLLSWIINEIFRIYEETYNLDTIEKYSLIMF